MKNKLSDLNNYLFESIERLMDDELSNEELEREIKRSDAIQKVAKTIIDNGSLAPQAQKHFDEYGIPTQVEMPLLGVTDTNLIEENANLRKQVKKREQW